ncbi:MAG: NADH:flavin oxidoreductase/NADH oxidase [Rhizobiales bacterium]|nr:NADH:flavin oxidoreductase/NADH oxidase [Hyphomicrobiales bacterium]
MGTPALFSPLTVRGLTLKNRIVLSPMCQYQAEEGHITDWHVAHHGHFSMTGLGLAFVEASGVTRNGRITYGCTGIWDDSHIAGMKKIVDMYHARGTMCGIQIGHAGRRASCERPWQGAGSIERDDGPEAAWQIIGPSAIPEREGYPVPHVLTKSEIADLVTAFEDAARRSLKAGFDVIEVHGAHGYLLHSFFSPISNQRTDEYGGSRQARMRLPLEVASAVRAICPDDMPVFYRASCVDGLQGGLVIEDAVALARELKTVGIDVLDCSSGGMAGPATLSKNRITPGYMVPYAETIRRDAGIATMAVGAIIHARQAEDIIASGKADLIAIAREMMADANWPYHAAQALGVDNPHAVLPEQYAFYLERRAAVLDRNA